MSYVRTRLSDVPFAQVANDVLNDTDLSAEALGVLCFLIGKSNSFRIMPRPLANRFGCGRDKIYRILNELIEARYITREKPREENGQFGDQDYVVFDRKQRSAENQEAALIPNTENPHPENPPQRNTDSTKDKKTQNPAAPSVSKKSPKYSEEFEAIWKAYPNGSNKFPSFKAFQALDPIDRMVVKQMVPIYAHLVSGKEERYIPHMSTWLNARRFDDLRVSKAVTSQDPNHYKNFSRAEWISALKNWRCRGEEDRRWSEGWGPPPTDLARCACPAELLHMWELHPHDRRFFVGSELRYVTADHEDEIMLEGSKPPVDKLNGGAHMTVAGASHCGSRQTENSP